MVKQRVIINHQSRNSFSPPLLLLLLPLSFYPLPPPPLIATSILIMILSSAPPEKILMAFSPKNMGIFWKFESMITISVVIRDAHC